MADLSVLAMISLCLLTISINFSDSKPVSGFSLKLTHIYSPAGNLSQLERVERLVKVSKEKAAYVQSLSRNSTYDHEKLTLPINPHLHYLYGEVEIGKPPVPVKLLMDTGSGLIWTQCEPCLTCYDQGSHRYNTQFSDTYEILPCLPNDGWCTGNQFSCINGECKYVMSYGDEGSSGTTNGSLSLESFIFSAGRGRGFTTIPNIVFGCSNDSKLFVPFVGHIAGIMGLDLSRYSLNAQLQGQFGSRFSYCIVPFFINDPTVSLLRFGDDIPQPKPTIQVQEINYYFKPGLSYYFLKLIGISVGPTRLQFREDAIAPHDQGGATFVDMYMDTGNPFGGIGRTTGGVDVYAPVIRAFEDYHAARHILHKLPETNVEFELCYYYPPEGFNDYPTLTYHFEGADYVVDGKNVLVHFPDPAQMFFCVGVKKTEGLSVLGGLLMQDKRIIVDGMNSKIQFYPEQCIYDIYNYN